MRKSKTLAKIRSGQTVRICGLGHFIPAFIRHAAHFGFDCIWLDLEHRVMSDREVQALLAFFHLFDIDCMIRAPTLEKTGLYRYLEDGATGLMIPHVSTPEKAQMLVQSVKFPPLGDRGLDGAGLDSDFVLRGDAEFPRRANEETFLFVQIETIEAVENVEEIAAVDGVDGLFVGPADLSLRLQFADAGFTLEQAQQRVAVAAAKFGKPWGRPTGVAGDLQKLHAAGARLLSFGGDFSAFMKTLEQSAKEFDRLD